MMRSEGAGRRRGSVTGAASRLSAAGMTTTRGPSCSLPAVAADSSLTIITGKTRGRTMPSASGETATLSRWGWAGIRTPKRRGITDRGGSATAADDAVQHVCRRPATSQRTGAAARVPRGCLCVLRRGPRRPTPPAAQHTTHFLGARLPAGLCCLQATRVIIIYSFNMSGACHPNNGSIARASGEQVAAAAAVVVGARS